MSPFLVDKSCLTLEVHQTEDTGGAGPVGSHETVDQDRLAASQAVLHELEERTNKQGQVLQAVSCVSPPESHVEGEVTENTRRKSRSHILIETSTIMGSDYRSGAEKGRQHFMIPNIVLS